MATKPPAKRTRNAVAPTAAPPPPELPPNPHTPPFPLPPGFDRTIAPRRPPAGAPAHVALWNAINDYTRACRGVPERFIYGNTPRMTAVVAVERALDELLAEAGL